MPVKASERGADAIIKMSAGDTLTPVNPSYFSMKYISLVLLVFQNCMLILTMRYTRTLPGDMYFSTTTVVVTEAVKMSTCVLILLVEHNFKIFEFGHYLKQNIVDQPLDTLKVAVPAFIYMIQNNLLFIAVSNLSAATYQVSYQLKILTTALFSVVMLKRSLVWGQWFALFLLFIGVAVVQIQPADPSKRAGEAVHTDQSPLKGLLAVIASCVSSGFAGVYFEKILKGSKASLWLRNIQLGLLGAVLGLGAMWLKDGEAIQEKGFFFGYTKYVWMVIALQALGGLLVAVVVKYADNILKGFATSFSIIVSTVASVYLFNFSINIQFSVGASLVMLAIFLYGRSQADSNTQK
ncbi:UDP-galactose translocator-like [Anneissia japonica]|uniref:UDP-galactose translocator-like n=1 Tax=Anneissia japonica TaxID=1529436 RepID=UPI00142560E2|nr:UDP-galactose translocator-like [Anneissia japonica]